MLRLKEKLKLIFISKIKEKKTSKTLKLFFNSQKKTFYPKLELIEGDVQINDSNQYWSKFV